MANRLTRIYTRTGDDGTTGLADGTRIPKHGARVEALGSIDELSCALGVLLTEALSEDVRALFLRVQHELFEVGGQLAMPQYTGVNETHVAALEAALDRYNESLPPLKEFILPGGSRAGAFCHQARAVCRRAERALVALNAQEALATPMLQYVNRLSDLLFVLGRIINRDAGVDDVLWRRT
jgi:cob(I)alamin adenosyltransferase